MYDEVKVNALLRLAKYKRHRLINSQEYGNIMLQLLLQLLNLNSSNFTFSKLEPYKPNIELLALYQEYVKCNSNLFSHRNTELIESSLEDSLYSSIEPKLLENYLVRLVNNNQDSFLILPLTVIFFEEDDWYAHEVGAIIKKIEGDFVVSIIDKADILIKNRTQVSLHELDEENQYKRKKGIVEYKYKINRENAEQLSYILGSCLLTDMVNIKRKVDLLMENHIQELLFSELSALSMSEEWGTREGNYQQYLDNCFGKEVDATIRYVLFDREAHGTCNNVVNQSLQQKIEQISQNIKLYFTKDIYKDLTTIIDKQLELLAFDPLVYKPIISELFQKYLNMKELRKNCPFQKKIQAKEASVLYSQKDLSVRKLKPTNIKPSDFKNSVNLLVYEMKEQQKEQQKEQRI